MDGTVTSLVTMVHGLIVELEALKLRAKRSGNAKEARQTVESILRAVLALADLTGARAPSVHVNVDLSPSDGLREAEELLCLLLDSAGKQRLIRRLQESEPEALCAVGVQQAPEALIPLSENGGRVSVIVDASEPEPVYPPGSLEARQAAMRRRHADDAILEGE